MLTCIKPIYAPIMPGIFSRENDRYGATICVDDTCHADPKRVTGKIESNKKLIKMCEKYPKIFIFTYISTEFIKLLTQND